MATNGNNILIYVGGAAVAGTRSNEIQSGCDIIEIASPDSGAWKAFLAGRKEWSFISSWLVTNTADVKRVLQVGTTVTVRIVGRGDNAGMTGSAIIESCKVTATRGNIANGSFVFRGTGPLTEEEPPT